MVQAPMTDGSMAHIPTIVEKDTASAIMGTYTTEEEKCALLIGTFFPLKLVALPPFPSVKGPFPTPLPLTHPSVSLISKTILKMSPYKAPGPYKIPNVVLHKTITTLAPLLHKCLITILMLNYCPKAWRMWLTIILHKPGWPDYTIAKAY